MHLSKISSKLILILTASLLAGCGSGVEHELKGNNDASIESKTSKKASKKSCLAVVKNEVNSNPALRDNKFVTDFDVSCENGYVTIQANCFELAQKQTSATLQVLQLSGKCQSAMSLYAKTAENAPNIKSASWKDLGQ